MKSTRPSNEMMKKLIGGDIHEESEAIKDYSKRHQQAKGRPPLRKTLKHIKTDEQEHKKKLKKHFRKM